MNRKKWSLFVTFFALMIPTLHAQVAPQRVAILGDSITYDGRWVTRVEASLRASPEFATAEIVNFGLSSETLSGLSEAGHAGGKFPRPSLHERLARILTGFKPTLVLACYGMNDGLYQPSDPARTKAFQSGVLKVKAEVEARGGKIIFITPPLYKADHPADDSVHYDAVLDDYSHWLVSRSESGMPVIDIRADLKQAIAAEKAKNPEFIYAADGIHPGEEGHCFIAESVTRQLWPLLKLSDQPKTPENTALAILGARGELLKHAWLTQTRHTRPEIPQGLPMIQANARAAKLIADYRTASSAVSDWSGYQRLDFSFAGRAGILVCPKQPAPGNPWIWRTEFFGHEPQGDIALLGRGFHLAYIDLQNLYGAPASLKTMDCFYEYLTKSYQLSGKAVMIGFSRGGLFALNWATLRPNRVAGLYLDAPVCDFKSWPAGKGLSKGSPGDWQNLLKVYEMTEAQALAYHKNPIDTLAPIAKAHIPILAIVGAADVDVPPHENIDIVEKRYLTLGGKIKVIRKPGCQHHPHSLPDPKPIVDFVVSCYPLKH
jgi:pimeloyl-ACP methyl ester carboxylesterase/lysophospholipase L1-like esterase